MEYLYTDNIKNSIDILCDLYTNVDDDKIKEAICFAIDALKCRLPINALKYDVIDGKEVFICKKCGQLMFAPEQYE